MYLEAEQHVVKAAAAFHAAATAGTEEDRAVQLEIAADLVRLIQCHGNVVAARIIKTRELNRRG